MKFKVKLLPAEREIEVRAHESVLDAALGAGFAFPYSCRNGACGACLGELIDGKIDYPSGTPDILGEQERRENLAAFCQARPVSDLIVRIEEITQLSAQRTLIVPVRVERMEHAAPDVKRLWLRLPPNERLPYLAGQYVDIILRDGRRRSFSIANRPDADSVLELHVRLSPGGRFTTYVFEALRARDLLRIEGPLGTFFVRDSQAPAILVAGGTGFAPIKGIVEHLTASGSTRNLQLFWGARTRQDLYLHELAQQWHDNGTLQYTPVLSEPDGEWQGATGFVHQQVLRQNPALQEHEVYMSGPPAMINAARTAFVLAGLDRSRLWFDAFDYADDTALR